MSDNRSDNEVTNDDVTLLAWLYAEAAYWRDVWEDRAGEAAWRCLEAKKGIRVLEWLHAEQRHRAEVNHGLD